MNEDAIREIIDERDKRYEAHFARIETQILSEIKGLRDMVDERDRRYGERDEARQKAVDAALAAQKEQTASSFTASEKAIVKAEDAQKEYNARSNEFRGQLDDQARRLIPRTEVEARVKSREEKFARQDLDIRSLRESRSGETAGSQGRGDASDQTRANMAMAISVISVIGMIILLVKSLMGS